MEYITIGDTQYKIEDLDDNVKALLARLQNVNNKLHHLSIEQTELNVVADAYSKAIVEAITNPQESAPDEE